jgi:hypothetical protein
MGNVCPYEIATYDMDLAHFPFLRIVIPDSFLTPQSPFLITAHFSMADFSQGKFILPAAPSRLVFFGAVYYAIFEQPLTEV